MQLSVSQVKDFRGCQRRWYLNKVERIPGGPPQYGHVYGHVLHACIERWLLKKEPFPPGWQWDEENKARIDPADEALLQTMIAKAIETQVLRRPNDVKVEYQFYKVFRSTDDWSPRPFVTFTGFIDGCSPGEVQDHKGIKDDGYALSKDELRADPQLNVYARAMVEAFQWPHDKPIVLRHNYFNRTTGRVFYREVTVSVADVFQQIRKLEADVPAIMQVAKARNFKLVPAAIDGHHGGVEECTRYRGCPYLSLCQGRKSLASFKVTALRLRLGPQSKPDFEECDMAKAKTSVFDDEDEDETPPAKPAKKAAKAPAEPEDEDEEEPAPVVKKKAKPAPVDDEEEEEPAPKPKARAKPASEPDEDEEPAPKPKTKAKPVVEDDEDEEPAPKPKAKAKPASAEETEDEEEKPAKKVKLPIASILANDFEAFRKLPEATLIERLLAVKAAMLGFDTDAVAEDAARRGP